MPSVLPQVPSSSSRLISLFFSYSSAQDDRLLRHQSNQNTSKTHTLTCRSSSPSHSLTLASICSSSKVQSQQQLNNQRTPNILLHRKVFQFLLLKPEVLKDHIFNISRNFWVFPGVPTQFQVSPDNLQIEAPGPPQLASFKFGLLTKISQQLCDCQQKEPFRDRKVIIIKALRPLRQACDE